jgi:hypothetical protein
LSSMTWRQSGFSCGSRGFGFSPIQAGGSLAGKDSSDASSTGSVSGDGGCGEPASGGEGVRVGGGLVTGHDHLTPVPAPGNIQQNAEPPPTARRVLDRTCWYLRSIPEQNPERCPSRTVAGVYRSIRQCCWRNVRRSRGRKRGCDRGGLAFSDGVFDGGE